MLEIGSDGSPEMFCRGFLLEERGKEATKYGKAEKTNQNLSAHPESRFQGTQRGRISDSGSVEKAGGRKGRKYKGKNHWAERASTYRMIVPLGKRCESR
jgi:hypothetical protein